MSTDSVIEEMRHAIQLLLDEVAGDERVGMEVLAAQFDEAAQRYAFAHGPSAREDVFMTLRRVNEAALRVTGRTLAAYLEADGAPPLPLPSAGRDSAVVRCVRPDGGFATGFVINPALGYVVSCAHSFDDAASCTVSTSELGLAAAVTFASADIDMCLLRLCEAGHTLTEHFPRPRARVSALSAGDELICIGRRPQGYLAQRQAHVANPSIQLDDAAVRVPVAELDATLQPGFSGAPAVSLEGELRGVAIARVTTILGTRESDVGILLPVHHLLQWITTLEGNLDHVIWRK